jgi:hypothetical protein
LLLLIYVWRNLIHDESYVGREVGRTVMLPLNWIAARPCCFRVDLFTEGMMGDERLGGEGET